MSKEEIENKLYEEDLTLEELLELKEEMKKHSFSDSDYEDVDEMITDSIEVLDTSEIKELKNKYSKYDTSLFDKVIYMREICKNKLIEDMTKEELEYILYEEELSAVDILRVYTCMKKYDFSDFDYKHLNNIFEDSIYDMSLYDLKRVRNESYKYKCDTSIINKYIDRFKSNNKLPIGRILFLGILGGLLSGSKGKKITPWEVDNVGREGYEDFNFEEEDLEEDDFHYEDID